MCLYITMYDYAYAAYLCIYYEVGTPSPFHFNIVLLPKGWWKRSLSSDKAAYCTNFSTNVEIEYLLYLHYILI